MKNKDQILLESLYENILLLEKGSPILFHYTGISNALNMVNSGKINLTYASGSDRRDSSKGKAYYFSLSRIRHGGYNHGSPWDAVLFEFDGSKLGSKYQIRPVDYWGYSWDLQRTSPIADEQEDRLFSHDQEIPLYPYLKSINVYVRPEGHRDFKEDNLKRAKFIKKKAEENNIPCFIYNDLNAWRTNNRRKAVDLESSDEMLDSDKPLEDSRVRGGGKDIMTILKIIQDPFNKQQDKDVKDFLYRYKGSDWKSSVNTMIGNARTEKNSEVRNTMYELSKLERKNKKNVLDLLSEVYDVIRTYEHIIQMKSAIDSFIYSITGEKPSGGIKKEQLKLYLERYSNKFEAKLVGERFVDLLNMAIAKLPQGNDDYSETLSYIQKAKEYLDSLNMEERSYFVAKQGNLYT